MLLRYRKYALFAVLALLLTYLLLPLTSARWTLTADAAALQAKIDLLAEPLTLPAKRPPNLVLILADDLGKYDLSLYGPAPVQTPHIDSIARRGVRFSEAYVTSPICSPSRAALLTGRYQQRFGHEHQPHERYPRNRLEYLAFQYFFDTEEWIVADDKREYPRPADIRRQGLPPSEITLAEWLRKFGYRTGIFGKWHLGYHAPSLPLQMGFDHHYGFYEAYSLYADPDDPRIVNQRHDDFSDPYIWGKGRTGGAAIRVNDSIVDEAGYLTYRIAEEACRFIQEHEHEPFFLYVPFSAPHTPFQAPRELVDRFGQVADPNKQTYYAMIAALDEAVGSIVGQLRKSGLDDNTLLVFLSDNGGATYTKATSNAPLKGGKFTFFEGGINVPMAWQWPDRLPPGGDYNQPVSALDLFPTFCAAAGIPLPPGREIDGIDLLPFLEGRQSGSPHEALYWRSGYLQAIRSGPWKMIVDSKGGGRVLYQLEEDPFERRNRWESDSTTVRRLQADLDRWQQVLSPPAWPPVMDFRFADGDAPFYFPL